jgi:multidrug resistance efflux pump
MTPHEMQAEIERLREHLSQAGDSIERIHDLFKRQAAAEAVLNECRAAMASVKAALDPVEAEHERGWAQWKDRVNITR